MDIEDNIKSVGILICCFRRANVRNVAFKFDEWNVYKQKESKREKTWKRSRIFKKESRKEIVKERKKER